MCWPKVLSYLFQFGGGVQFFSFFFSFLQTLRFALCFLRVHVVVLGRSATPTTPAVANPVCRAGGGGAVVLAHMGLATAQGARERARDVAVYAAALAPGTAEFAALLARLQ